MLTGNPIILAPFFSGFISVIITIYSCRIWQVIARWRTPLLFFSVACYCFGYTGIIAPVTSAPYLSFLHMESDLQGEQPI